MLGYGRANYAHKHSKFVQRWARGWGKEGKIRQKVVAFLRLLTMIVGQDHEKTRYCHPTAKSLFNRPDLHAYVILLQRPESFRVLLSCAN